MNESTQFPVGLSPSEAENETLPVDNQPVAENVSTGDQFSPNISETSPLESGDASMSVDSENPEETSSEIDISKEVLTEDADDTESFLDDTQNI
jgi:hypothetical protein